MNCDVVDALGSMSHRFPASLPSASQIVSPRSRQSAAASVRLVPGCPEMSGVQSMRIPALFIVSSLRLSGHFAPFSLAK